jgi:predicted transcriptional regulator
MEAIGPLQLRVMHYVWQHGPSTVHAVLDTLNRQPGCAPLAYTTILTVMRNLVRRGFLSQKPEGRSHVFAPLVDESSYKLDMLRQLRRDLFAGDVTGLLRFLTRDDEIAADQRERIAALAP